MEQFTINTTSIMRIWACLEPHRLHLKFSTAVNFACEVSGGMTNTEILLKKKKVTQRSLTMEM